jgi:hypothetical protein
MITLDGLQLPIDLVWTDKAKYQPVAMNTQYTLGGSVVVFSQALLNGRHITLEAKADMGWIYQDVAEALIAKASVPDAVYSLTIGSESFNVMFRHTEPPAVDLEPLVDGYQPSPYYKGVLKFFTI